MSVPVAPVQVWEVLTDVRRLPAWLTLARDVEVDDPAGAQQRFTVHGGHRGVSRTVRATVDAWEPTSRYGWAVDDPLHLRFRYTLDGDDARTRMQATVEADLSDLPRMATRFAVRSLRREFARSLTAFEDLATR